MFSRVASWYARVLAAAVVLVGCTQATDKPRVALIMKSLANEFFMTMEDGAVRSSGQRHQR